MNTTDERPDTIDDTLAGPPSPRDRILRAAALLLAEGGREAVSTRAVSAAAGVQPPTIYRQFGDMRGLLDAVAADGFARHLQNKIGLERTEDPVADLRTGWDAHIGFGLANPALYALMYGDPRPGAAMPTAAVEARKLLDGLLQRLAAAGRLRVDVGRATRLIHAAGVGVVLTLIAVEDTDRDLAVSDLTRETIIAALITDTTPPSGATAGSGSQGAVAHANALKAVLPEVAAAFTTAERSLLAEWLDRLIRQP